MSYIRLHPEQLSVVESNRCNKKSAIKMRLHDGKFCLTNKMPCGSKLICKALENRRGVALERLRKKLNSRASVVENNTP